MAREGAGARRAPARHRAGLDVDAVEREPLGDRLGRVAVVLRARTARRTSSSGSSVDLVAAEGQVGGHDARDLGGAGLLLRVDRAGALGDAQLDVVDGGDRLVGVLEADEQVDDVWSAPSGRRPRRRGGRPAPG
jgi:hypothetical protein